MKPFSSLMYRDNRYSGRLLSLLMDPNDLCSIQDASYHDAHPFLVFLVSTKYVYKLTR